MTVQECYEKMGGNYAEVIDRLMSEERVAKYLGKFLESSDFDNMLRGLEGKDYELAFRSVHNLKGMSLNLSFTPLHRTSDILCEALRGGEPKEDISGMLEDVKQSYARVTDAIKEFKG